MPSFLEITPDKLNRIIGTPNAPTIIDVRNAEDFAADTRLIPGSVRRDYRAVTDWAEELTGPSVVLCQKGQKLGHGVAAHLRAVGKAAEVLEGGFEAWRASKASLVPEEKPPARDSRGRTVWVTRSRPKIDRIACPWLIRRFVDPSAVFLFVPAAEVSAVADRFSATPFDIEEVYWSHRGELCTFDQKHLHRQHLRQGAPLGPWRQRGAKNQAIGPSRGGQTTKIHVLTDVIGRPFAFMLTGGNAADSPVAPHLLAGLKGARYLLADKGYDANSLRKRLRQSAIVPVIPGRSNRTRPIQYDAERTRAATSSRTPSAD